MHRVLNFTADEDGQRRFALAWESLIVGGLIVRNTKRSERTEDQIRREAKLTRALKTISQPAGHFPGGELDQRALTPEGGTVTLEQPQLDVLLSYAKQQDLWGPDRAEDAVDLWDWLAAAPQQDE